MGLKVFDLLDFFNIVYNSSLNNITDCLLLWSPKEPVLQRFSKWQTCFSVSDTSSNKYKKESTPAWKAGVKINSWKAMLRWWVGDRLRYFSGKSERKNTCGESRISMLCLKLSEYFDRKVVIGKRWSFGSGEVLFWANFFFHPETHA